MNRITKRQTVLVVDDQERNVQLVGATLVAMGYEIIPASSGEQALQRMAAREPDLILLDVLMPEMDGFEVCAKIQENPATSRIPIIFLSAADDKNIIVRALESGAVDYVTKPFNKAELISRVRTHLDLKSKTDRLRELVDQRDEFMSILAHDLKNPLTGIRFSAQMLDERADEYNDRTRKLVASILDSANNMMQFIEHFLEDKAKHSMSFSAEIEAVNLSELVRQAIGHQYGSAKKKEIDLKMVGIKDPCWISSDKKAITQILDNLISNAVKFSPPGRSVEIDVQQGQVEIRDQGPGFTDEDKEQMFSKYVRLSARPTAGEGSTGLGLSIVKRLMDMIGGEIVCESTPGQGTTFRLTLPCDEESDDSDS